ncbi:MAG: zinc ribbon domain-containing protein, partial [Anaerolineae bacterium]
LFFPLFPFPGLVLYMLLRPRTTLEEIYERSLEEEALLQGIEERMACPGCNRRIEEEFMICPTCHTRLKKACPACGRLLHLRWNICPYCGAVQTSTKAATLLDTQRAPLPVEPGVEAPKLADTTLQSEQEPATDWPDQPEWAFEPEVEPESEIAASDEPAEPTEESAYDADTTPETEEQAESGEDSEPEEETLPFGFD